MLLSPLTWNLGSAPEYILVAKIYEETLQIEELQTISIMEKAWIWTHKEPTSKKCELKKNKKYFKQRLNSKSVSFLKDHNQYAVKKNIRFGIW